MSRKLWNRSVSLCHRRVTGERENGVENEMLLGNERQNRCSSSGFRTHLPDIKPLTPLKISSSITILTLVFPPRALFLSTLLPQSCYFTVYNK